MKKRSVTPTTQLPQDDFQCQECAMNLRYMKEIIARDTYIGTLRGILYDLTFKHTKEELIELQEEARYLLKRTSYDIKLFDQEVKEYLGYWNKE